MIVIQMQHAQIRLVHIIALAKLDSVEMAKSIAQVRVVFCSVAFSVVIFFIQFKCIDNGFIYSCFTVICSCFPDMNTQNFIFYSLQIIQFVPLLVVVMQMLHASMTTEIILVAAIPDTLEMGRIVKVACLVL